VSYSYLYNAARLNPCTAVGCPTVGRRSFKLRETSFERYVNDDMNVAPVGQSVPIDCFTDAYTLLFLTGADILTELPSM